MDVINYVFVTYSCFYPTNKTCRVAECIESSPRSREIAVSSPDRAKRKALELVLVVSSLNAEHKEDTTRTSGPGVRIM